MKLKGIAAIHQGNNNGGKIELPGDPKINVLEWTTSEHYQKFISFLGRLTSKSSSDILSEVRKIKNGYGISDQSNENLVKK